MYICKVIQKQAFDSSLFLSVGTSSQLGKWLLIILNRVNKLNMSSYVVSLEANQTAPQQSNILSLPQRKPQPLSQKGHVESETIGIHTNKTDHCFQPSPLPFCYKIYEHIYVFSLLRENGESLCANQKNQQLYH